MGGFAWVTLATNDSYSLGALVLAHSLRKSNTAHKLAVLITPAVSQPIREQLARVFDVIKVVDVVDSKDQAHLALMKRPELGVTFTKIHCWTLTEFDKCVFLDADTLVVRNCDELFEREEFSAAPDASWPDCFNSGVFVYKPSVETFSKLLQFAVEKGSFDGGDQGLLNEYFSGWATEDIKKHLPFVYNLTSIAVYSYIPAFKQYGSNTRIVHFIGTGKPWLQQLDPATRTITPNAGSEHLTPLLQTWWDLFCEKVHPQLNKELDFANGLSPVHLEACSNTITACTDVPEMPPKVEPCTSYREENDFRQIGLPYQPFDVKSFTGELINEGFVNYISEDSNNEICNVMNPPEEVIGVDDQNKSIIQYIIQGVGETCANGHDDRQSVEQKISHYTEQVEEKKEVPKNAFDYNTFFPDDACVSHYLQQNVLQYQPFEDQNTNFNNSNIRTNETRNDVILSPNKSYDEGTSSLPRFLTIPENDQRQMGNCTDDTDIPQSVEHGSTIMKNLTEEKFTQCAYNDIPHSSEHTQVNNICKSESTLIESTSKSQEQLDGCVAPRNDSNGFPRSRSLTHLVFDALSIGTSALPCTTTWKNHFSNLGDPNRRYSMPKLRPLLPKQKSFHKSMSSLNPKVTLWTELHMSSDYKIPEYLPSDNKGFVESHIIEKCELRRSQSDANIPRKFGPLPHAFTNEISVDSRTVTSKSEVRYSSYSPHFDMKSCKRQMGNRPKSVGDLSGRKESVSSTANQKSNFTTKRKWKKLPGSDREKRKVLGRDGEDQNSIPLTKVDTVRKTDNLNEILKRLINYSKDYLHYFGENSGRVNGYSNSSHQKGGDGPTSRRKVEYKDAMVQTTCWGDSSCACIGTHTPRTSSYTEKKCQSKDDDEVESSVRDTFQSLQNSNNSKSKEIVPYRDPRYWKLKFDKQCRNQVSNVVIPLPWKNEHKITVESNSVETSNNNVVLECEKYCPNRSSQREEVVKYSTGDATSKSAAFSNTLGETLTYERFRKNTKSPLKSNTPNNFNETNTTELLTSYNSREKEPGIAGAIAKLRLDTGNEMESSRDSMSSAHEDYLRRQNWETGNIDYMGRDSFDNIWSKICHTLDQKVPEEMRKNLGALKSCSDVLAKVEPGKNQSGDVKNGSEVLANATQQPVNTPTPCQAPSAQNKTKVAEQVQTPLETPKSQDKKSEIEPASPVALVQSPSQNVSPPPAATVVTSTADSKLSNQSPAQLPISPAAPPQKELPSLDVKTNQTAEKAHEKPPAACDQKSVPTGVAPNVILSAAPAAEAQEHVKPPHLSAIAPTQVVRITETPPTPIEKDVELNEFVEKQADVQKSEVKQPPLDQINQNTVPESPNQGTAMVPYCDVFQSIKCAQASETQHSQHKRNVEEIIKHQGEAKSAQFPPIPLPQSPTEEKPEVSLSDSQHAPCNTVTPEAERALAEGQEMKTSGSGSLKDEGKAKKGMISKILEIVGVTPKQGEEATSSVFYDGQNGAPKGDQQNLEKMPEKQVEQQAKEPAQAAAEGTPQEGNSVNAKVDTGNKANTVTEKESGNNNQKNHKNKRNKGKSPKPPTEKDDESNKKKQQERQKKNEPSSKGSPPPPPANKDKSPKDKDENAENKPDENKSAVAQQGDTAVGGAMQATAGKEGRRKSPSPKLSLQGCGESADKGSPLLDVDNTILETPPVTNQNFSKAETPEGKMLAGKVMAEIDQILDKAKTVVESKMEDRKSAEKQVAGEVPEAEAADEVNALKLITDDDKKEGPRAAQPDAKGSKQSKLPKPQQESKGGKRGPQKQPPPQSAPSGAVEIEELKVTSEEERKKHKSQPAPNSKLSDQILKAIPPPRRKAISDSKPEAGAIPKKPSGEAGGEPAKAGGKQGGGKPDPVPPPRNRSKPPHEAPPKGKTKK
ncbi:hypothetical protein RUM44_002425 [Polyplax serrata]|uniref:glycogenin glucosyltransferase n=1 Tax=Polyplax serrata TaxID=468196 RepID=A0ABR1AEU9_POLSC